MVLCVQKKYMCWLFLKLLSCTSLNGIARDLEYGGITMNGTVKFFNDAKRFGFIVAEDGKEFFVHQSGVQEGVSLREQDAVIFDVEQGDRGPKAVHVRKA